MVNGLEREGAFAMFSDDELREFSGVKRVGDYVEVTCGCTSRRFGDAVGRLRVFVNGCLEITCDCTPGCEEGLSLSLSIYLNGVFTFHTCASWSFGSLNMSFFDVLMLDKLTPAAFEKHSGRETARKWKNNVWVIVNGEKVPLFKTVLLKYYNQVSKSANGSQNGRACHRDEFVRCTKCNKERRFRLRTKEECRFHHDAVADANWQCSDLPYDKITCDDEEERASRRVYKGCTRSPTCKGCTSCVCFGCDICRFSDCSCQTCTDFTRNAKD
ncbi:protein ULTRAPETALA 1-like isoform X1 [Abrus precatorius]|uniref:Protein ULTRAPETALA 1-like isoform X1 n=1 Tax=Abrus precatorius TaxID=3816 RepID=A0A8B8KEU4_ABRPR|nr:protein ULTRAPETALA 1-like isoform X1 [Abrus precatorius]